MYRIAWLMLCLLSLNGMTSGAQSSAPKPNIVYVMADELGYFELSCMGN
ncbi:MAG: Cerebroside-sulfatase, partial [Planctomycetes bacterium]|nr:Cerebroside-sulfatase [Planctomycetota bacterium]